MFDPKEIIEIDKQLYRANIRDTALQLFIAEIQRQKKKGETDVIGAAERAIDDAITFQNVWDDFCSPEEEVGESMIGNSHPIQNTYVPAPIEVKYDSFMSYGSSKGYAPWMQEIIAAHGAGFITDEAMQKCYKGYEEASTLPPLHPNANDYVAQLGRAFHWEDHSFDFDFWGLINFGVEQYLKSIKDASSK